MIAGSKVGPNEPCPCGSGNKYKLCCQSAERRPSKKRRNVALGVLVALGVVGAGWASTLQSSPASDPAVGFRLGTPTGQPSGAAPAGKVWSQEHGHWHDAPEVGSGVTTGTTPSPSVTPPPAGDAPPGKVWSPEHGHWHDVN